MGTLMVYVTCPSGKVADEISAVLVRERLAACVNQVALRASVFQWKGKIEKEKEILLIAKTRREAFRRLQRRVEELHPYEVPEVIATRVETGNAPYLAWVRKEVRPVKSRKRRR